MTRKTRPADPPTNGTVLALRPNGIEYSRTPSEYIRLEAERIAGEITAQIRAERGWSPAIRVLDHSGRDITAAFARLVD